MYKGVTNMKCPSCGAETQNKFCEFCGSEMPQEKSTINITNNFYGEATQQNNNANSSAGKCPKCGSTKINFKRERVGTATQSTSRKNAVGSGQKGQSVSQAAYRTVGLCQNCGFTWNPNVGGTNGGKKGTTTWVWVLGWICIFPLPLTILLLRKKDMKPGLKYGIIAAAWILYLIIGLSGDSENTNNTTSTQTENIQVEQSVDKTQEETREETQEVTVESTEDKEPSVTESDELVDDVDSYILNIVEQYNSQATEQLAFVEDFTPSDKSSSHYRTEFRLGAYDDAVGKSYLLGDKVVDLVASETIMGDVKFRVYTNDISLEQVKALIQGMSPLMDETLSAADLNAALNEVETNKTANGYYYGELGITLFGSDERGYELMIKND